MNRTKWFLMSKYKKLLYQIKSAETNKRCLHLSNGVALDFSEDSTIDDSTTGTAEISNPVDIIKGLRCCAKDNGCDECPFNSTSFTCGEELNTAAADLIEKFILKKTVED
jgi:hypothetical protein